jgi:hypothetical protein
LTTELFVYAGLFGGLAAALALDALKARNGFCQLRQHIVDGIALFESCAPKR